MGLFKFLDLPKKEPGAVLNTADRQYLIKLIVAASCFTVALSICGTMLLLERHLYRMGTKAKVIMEWSKKANFATELLDDMFRVQQMKESYEKQGIKVDEAIINNNNKQEDNYEKKD